MCIGAIRFFSVLIISTTVLRVLKSNVNGTITEGLSLGARYFRKKENLMLFGIGNLKLPFVLNEKSSAENTTAFLSETRTLFAVLVLLIVLIVSFDGNNSVGHFTQRCPSCLLTLKQSTSQYMLEKYCAICIIALLYYTIVIGNRCSKEHRIPWYNHT